MLCYAVPVSENANIFKHPACKFSLNTFRNDKPSFLSLGQEGYKIGEILANRLQEVASLNANWDGYGANTIDKQIIENTKKIIHLLPLKFKKLLNYSDISPTPNGTILIEWNNKDAFLIVDIGYEGVSIAGETNTNKTIQKSINVENAFIDIIESLEVIYND